MRFNVYEIYTANFLGNIEFEECKQYLDILDLDDEIILNKFEPLFKKYDEQLFNKRFKEFAWFILVDANSLKPECEIGYFINCNENDKDDVLVDIPEHDTRATFFINLYDRYVDLINLKERGRL